MNINEMLQIVENRVSGGGQYLWPIMLDKQLRYVDFENAQGAGLGSFIVSNVGEVMEITCQYPEDDNNCFRWMNKDFEKLCIEEAEKRNVSHDVAWDNVKYTKVESSDEMCGFISQIMKGINPKELHEKNINEELNSYNESNKENNYDDLEQDIITQREKDFLYWSKVAAVLDIPYLDLMDALDNESPVNLELSDDHFFSLGVIAAEENKPLGEIVDLMLDQFISNYEASH
jgi:hypothetical protein